MLDWLIVGGGVHGTLSAHFLLDAGVPREKLRVLDPFEAPLHRFDRALSNAGVRYMRSTSVHHVDVDPLSLAQFARSAEGAPLSAFAAPYRRPSYELFAAHARHAVRRRGSDALRVRGRARGLARIPGGLRVESSAGALDARRVALALGCGEGGEDVPAWAAALRAAGGAVEHACDPSFDRAALPPEARVVVVGAGLTGVETALAVAEAAPGRTVLIRRRPPEIHLFDSDPGWLGPKYLAGFARLRDPAQRRDTVDDARRRGSLTPEAAMRLDHAVRRGALRVVAGETTGGRVVGAGVELDVALRDGTDFALPADRVVLATGFRRGRPAAPWLDAAIADLGLPLAPCGSPRLDAGLHWGAGVHVTGSLAELEIGPAARNVSGGRMAAARLARVAAAG